MTHAQPLDVIRRDRGTGPADTPPAATTHRPEASASLTSVEARRELVARLRVVHIHRETAATLEIRADRSSNTTFATLLRARAEQHRGVAEKLLSDLADRGLLTRHPARTARVTSRAPARAGTGRRA